jgi:hypothetical protein
VRKDWNRTAAVIVLMATTFALPAENSVSSGLTIQVNPESYLDTPVASLSFQVASHGEIAYSQPVTITAWVRALPGQQIHLTAQVSSLSGPSGSAPDASLAFTAAMSGASGGATDATCASGNFTGPYPQQLINDWNRSGIARCIVIFALVPGAAATAGTYNASVSFSLSLQ